MKGTIKVTQPNGNKVLVDVDRIYNVVGTPYTTTQTYKSLIVGKNKEMLSCMETPSEVKKLIEEAT